MRKFAEEYPNLEFVQEVLAQLTWYRKEYGKQTG